MKRKDKIKLALIPAQAFSGLAFKIISEIPVTKRSSVQSFTKAFQQKIKNKNKKKIKKKMSP